MSRDIIAYIDQQALCHNLNRIKLLAPNSAVLAMIKSNGYGHGLLRVANALGDADAFGVACLEEALALREVHANKPIVVMSGFLDQTELLTYVQNNLSAVIHHPMQVELLAKTKFQTSLPVWFKVNTGMNRLGFHGAEVEKNYKMLLDLPTVNKPIGLMTHLADADSQDKGFSERQIQDFFHVTQKFTGPRSIANSASLINLKNSHQDWVRPGIMLYGVSPFANKTGRELGLLPVMKLQAKLIAINTVKRGEVIGYGGTFIAASDMRVGVVAAGYGDGYPRHAKLGAPTLIQDQVCPLVGRVSMDLLTVDLAKCPNAQIGDKVVLWGGALPVEEVARYADTIGYELLCGVTQRVKFVSSAG